MVHRFTPPGTDIDSVFDVRAIFQQGHREVSLADMPGLLLPTKGRHGLVDYEKIFCADPKAGDIFTLRQVDRSRGCLVVVRPDQYIANMVPLTGHVDLEAYFSAFMSPCP